MVATCRASSHNHGHEYAAQSNDDYHRRFILYAREDTDGDQKQSGRHHSQQYPDDQSHLGVVVKMQLSGLRDGNGSSSEWFLARASESSRVPLDLGLTRKNIQCRRYSLMTAQMGCRFQTRRLLTVASHRHASVSTRR